MSCKNYWKKIISFGLAFLLGLLAVSILQTVVSYNKAQELMNEEKHAIKIQEKTVFKNIYPKQRRERDVCGYIKKSEGIGTCSHSSNLRSSGSGFSSSKSSGGGFSDSINRGKISSTIISGETKGLKVTYKPKAQYTKEAKKNKIEGTVTVRAVFLASGEIGAVTPVSNLPCGLTEQAIAAARKIKFEPQVVNGKPQTVIRSVQFSFTIY